MDPMLDDAHDLERFVTAQASRYAQARDELRAGRKRTHWMWFVFPQLRGLGSTDRAWRYGIDGLAEARAYLAHPVLGPRLLECLRLVLATPGTAEDVLGPVDTLKLRSCATLFDLASGGLPEARAVLDRWWGGKPDKRTLSRVGGTTGAPPPSGRPRA